MTAFPLDSAPPSYFESQRFKILVIENDMETADLLCNWLEDAGYEIQLATDGQYALMLAEEFLADLVVLDTEIPGTSSSDVEQILKNAPRVSSHYRRIPILYLAFKDLLINQRFHRHPDTPMNDFVWKPLEKRVFLDRVWHALQQPQNPD